MPRSCVLPTCRGRTALGQGTGGSGADSVGIYGLVAADLFAALAAARSHAPHLTVGLSMYEIYREGA